jgi:nucleotide-binding universal stress UspA family protein
MYRHLLVPLENSPADEVVLKHVEKLARSLGAKISIIHVAHGHVARNQKQLNLAPSEEMRQGRDYVAGRRAKLEEAGIETTAHLSSGEPSDEILAYAAKIRCDLIVMATHGHRFLADLVLGSVSSEVRHRTDIPVLLVRCPQARTRAK